MKPLKLFITLSVSLLIVLLPKKFASACGFFVSPGEYRFWLLQPDLTNQKDLTPFFFASTYLYKGNINAAVEDYPDKNVNEWYLEIKRSAPKKDIDSLLNDMPPQTFFNNEQEIAGHNKFLAFLHQPGNRELYHYLLLSKKVEQVAANPDPWGEERSSRPGFEALINEANALYKKARSPFVKLRSAYQLMRLYGYNAQTEKQSQVYDAWIGPVPSKSWIKKAALYQKAIHTGGYEGDYLLSKVFDQVGYNRSQCLMRIRSKNIDSILIYAKNRHEKTVIRAMQVFNFPGRSLSTIKQIYSAEPGYHDLAFLLLREINKLEDWLATTKLTKFERPATGTHNWWLYSEEEYSDDHPDINYRRDKRYGHELYDFLLQLIREKKQKNISLIRLYAAHLALLNNDPVASQQHLDQIVNTDRLPANIKTQVRINRFLLRLENGFTKETENEFMRLVSQSPEQLGIYDAAIMKDQLILYTARKLINKGEKAKGLMLTGQTRRALGHLPIDTYRGVYQEIEEIATPAAYDQILHILTKKNKTPFEKFIADNRINLPWNYYADEPTESLDKNKILDGKASWYIRNHDLNKALEVLRQIPDSFWHKDPYSLYIGGDPFYLNIHSAHKQAKVEKLNLNKKQVIERMLRLEKIAKADPQKAALCYYQLANAWYNMSWYGKNWLMVKQWWSNDEKYQMGSYPYTYFNDDYYGCKQSKEYYLKALQATKDKDLAVLCCFMADRCETNFQRYHLSRSNPNDDLTDYNNPANPYKRKLIQKKIDEARYDNLVKECALYIDFISKYNSVL